MAIRALRKWERWVLLSAAAVAAITAALFFALRKPSDIREAAAVRLEWQQATERMSREAKERLAQRSLEIGRKYSGTVGGMSALLLAAAQAPDTQAGQEAREAFAQQLATADVEAIAGAFDRSLGHWEEMKELAPLVLARARQSSRDARTGRLIAAVCASSCPKGEDEPPPIYTESADLIADAYADSPDIAHFCEGLGGSPKPSPSWAGHFERHLRAILRANQDRYVRCTAQFALAAVVQCSVEDRQAEAEVLYEQFCSEFDGEQRYRAQSIEKTLNSLARDQLQELKFRAVGRTAQGMKGIDLEGRPLNLNDYRGRVVLLSFWGTWCFPCMKLIPHELELVSKFRGQPFEIVGVNSDEDLEQAREAVTQNKMTWRSFRKGTATTNHWNVLSYPTLYLIDHHEVIRRRWIGSPPPEDLERTIAILVDAAQRSVASDAMQPVIAALATASEVKADPEASLALAVADPGTGFIDKVYRAADGSEAKYVVYIPRSFDRTKAVPAILYLHGAGSRGSDGRSHLKHGLAKTIRQRDEGLPFVVIFPQARENENWTAESVGGKRALAILKQVQLEYRIDANRLYLTGHSMGGMGTWSLAAAEPGRWAAIVPVSHGWQPELAAKLKELPCWCFHGDADQVISVERSREMVKAIQDAGGRPLYTEFSGVDHNTCADRAYALAELYEWLLLQDRTKR